MKLDIYKAAIKREGIIGGIMNTSATLLADYMVKGTSEATETKALHLPLVMLEQRSIVVKD